MSGIGTRYVRTARGVRVPAMTSHIMTGCDDILCYHWLQFEQVGHKKGRLDGEHEHDVGV